MDTPMNGEDKTCEAGHCKCNCGHHKVVPGMISLIAIVFLLGAFDVMSAEMVGILWPIFLLIAGLTKMSRNMCKCC